MAYTNSSLATYKGLLPHYTPGRKNITIITIHCTAGQTSCQGLYNTLYNSQASCNYGIAQDGTIGLYVSENNTSWCSSNQENDKRAITIEVSSDNYSPYAVSKAAYNSLIKLCADICERNNISSLRWKADPSLSYSKPSQQNMTAHRWFAQKSCFNLYTELLTPEGWKYLKDVKIGEKIASVNMDGLKISYEPIEDIVEPYKSDVYYNNGLMATKDHRMLWYKNNKLNEPNITSYADALQRQTSTYIPMAGYINNTDIPLTDDMIAFLIAVQSDGSYRFSEIKEKKIPIGLQFHFSKERKVKHLKEILNNLEIKYTFSQRKDKTYNFYIPESKNPGLMSWVYDSRYIDKNKCFTWKWINMSYRQANFFLKEIMLWDGCEIANSFFSMQNINLDIISAIASLNGVGSYTNYEQHIVKLYKYPYITLGLDDNSTKRIEKRHKQNEKYTTVSCVTVKTGLILVRQEGKTFIIGNCPGDYLYNKFTDIANRVNKLLGSGYKNPAVSITGGSSSSSSGGSSGVSSDTGTITGTYDEAKAWDDGTKAAWIKDQRTNQKSSKIEELKQKIANIDNYVSSKHDITSFIWFKVNDFELDTRSGDSFQHYAISMENQKTGVGQGNKFTIKIAYHKHFSNYSDINQLEQALGPLRNASTMSYNSDIMTNTKNDLYKNVCYLQYGYLSVDNKLISPKYEGLLLSYKVNAKEQIVEYTLTGYTGEQTTENVVNWYPNIVGIDEVQTETGTVGRAKLATKNGSNNQINDNDAQVLIKQMQSMYNGSINFNPYLALDCFLQDYNANAGAESTKYYLLDCTSQKKGKLSDPSTLEPVRMSLCKNQTVMQYIEYCIGLFKYKSTTDYALENLEQNLETSDRFVYDLVRDKDDKTKMFICVDVMSAEDTDSRVAYNFVAYTPDNALTLDYSLEYDGTVALAIADNYSVSKSDNAYYIDKNGKLSTKTSKTNDIFVGSGQSDVLISKQNTWLDKVSVANKCTLTTYGLPFEITVGTIFKCGIYITDVLHHSSGNCFVTGITDYISNNNFTTVFNMIRLPGKNSAINN